MNPFHLPKLDSSSLIGYREDKAALKKFERRFALPSYLGILGLIIGMSVPLFWARHQLWPIPLILGGFGILAVTWLLMFFSTPRSASGRPMAKYWNTASDVKGKEVVYVCDQSKTYFRRTIIEVDSSS